MANFFVLLIVASIVVAVFVGYQEIIDEAEGHLETRKCSSRDSQCSSELKNFSDSCRLIAYDNGNIVLYDDDIIRWESKTSGVGIAPYRLILQANGDLVYYDANNELVWASGNSGDDGVSLGPYEVSVDDSCNLIIADNSGTIKWDLRSHIESSKLAAEAARLAEEAAAAEAARLMVEEAATDEEAARLIAEEEAAKLAADEEAARLMADEEAARLVVEEEAKRLIIEKQSTWQCGVGGLSAPMRMNNGQVEGLSTDNWNVRWHDSVDQCNENLETLSGLELKPHVCGTTSSSDWCGKAKAAYEAELQ